MNIKGSWGKRLMLGFFAAVICSAGVVIAANNTKADKELLNRANQTLQHLKNRDFKKLAQFVHSNVKFSQYGGSDDLDSVKFTPAQLKVLKLTDKFTWGKYDGSGDPIDLSVEDYFKEFVFPHDFTKAPEIGVSLKEHCVQYHFPGFNPEFEGLDWATLTLLFEKVDKQWMLTGVVHNCWTI